MDSAFPRQPRSEKNDAVRGEHLMRPISREYDEKEHENPMEFFNTMWEASRGNRDRPS